MSTAYTTYLLSQRAMPFVFIDRTQSLRLWPLFAWYISLCRAMPFLWAKARSVTFLPFSSVTKIVQRLPSCCCSCVAHRQLEGRYQRFEFFLSRVVPFGRSPMSSRKVSNLPHLLQTLIPRPPYKLYLVAFGLLHRSCMLFQERYSFMKRTLSAARSCGTKLLSNFSWSAVGPLRTQPQLRDCPCVMVYPSIGLDTPQSHLQNQRTAPCGEFSTRLIATSLPNRWPERSRNGIGMSVSLSRMNS